MRLSISIGNIDVSILYYFSYVNTEEVWLPAFIIVLLYDTGTFSQNTPVPQT